MQSKWMRRLGMSALLGCVAYASVGCAEEREPRDLVQPNALDKSFFVGAKLRDASDDPEFYMRNTVVNVPYGAGVDGLFTATYAQPLNRIKWQVTEDSLIARMTHERIENSDHKGSKRTNDGTVVAMFRILSHFDVKRSYNPGTGEDLNVVEENTSDRPWYDRQYIRVDWSMNMVTDGYQVDTLSQLGAFGSVHYSPIAFKVEDPTDPNRPVFSPEEGYFDVTQKAFASPDMIDTPWGRYPSCFFGGSLGNLMANCNPTEITMRLSFKKVVDTDFEPVEWDGKKMDAFGVFLEERFGYDRNFGLIDDNWHRYAALHNIWQKSHIEGSQCAVDFWRDADGNIAKYKQNADGSFAKDAKTGLPIPDPKGAPYPGTPVGKDYHRDELGTSPEDGKLTEDDCEFYDGANNLLHKGAYCDVASKKCALPKYERKLKTIPWYYGPESTDDLFPSSSRALNDWNLAVKYAALVGMRAEAQRVGVELDPKQFGTDTAAIQALLDDLDEDALRKDKADADAAHKLPAIPDIFVMCHSPTADTDAEACWRKDAKGNKQPVFARIGDIRYNHVNLINDPESIPLLGIMVDAVDPLTGEKVAGSANNWAAHLDSFVQTQMDLLRWVNGEISDEQITSGKYLRDWVEASKLGAAPYMPKPLPAGEAQRRVESVDRTIMKMNGLTEADSALPRPIRIQKAHQHLANTLGPSVTPEINAAQAKLANSRWEAAMITPEMLQFAGLPPNSAIADERTLQMASPFRGMLNPKVRQWFEQKRAQGLARNHACMIEQPEPNGIVGLARWALKNYPLPDASKGGACQYDANLDQKADYPACRVKRDTKLAQYLRDQFNFAILSHELGHSMALRHNFTGSVDAFNFHPEYWQLRTRMGEEKVCQNSIEPHTDGKDCVGPRWVDPVTDDEVEGVVWRFAMSTVMDYPGDPTGDMNGLGPYDKAAARMIYGGTVDVDEDAVIGTDKGDAFIGALDGTDYYGNSQLGVHYSKLNDLYKLIDKNRCKPLVANPQNPLDYKCSYYGKEPGKRLLHVSLKDMKARPKYGEEVLKLRPDLVANFAVYEVADPANPKKTRQMARHPYQFMSDEYADTSNVGVYRHDWGADPYEAMQFIITSYENRYIFDNFRRDRVMFSPGATAQRVMGRYMDKIHGMSKAFFLRADSAQPKDLESADALQGMALATADAFDMFVRSMTRPEPGNYVIDKSGTTAVARGLTPAEAQANVASDFKIAAGSGEGRFVNNDYDYSKGELWYQYPLVAGTWFEKIVSVYYLLEAENNYVSNQKEDYIDGRYKNTNFSNVYPNQMRRLFAQLFQGDVTTLGPYTGGNTGTLAANKVARVQYLPWYAWNEKEATTVNLDYPKDAVVLNPLFGWNQQMYGIINTFIYGTTKLTMDMVDQMRIFTTGDQSTVSIQMNEQVRYQDPFSGLIYVARNYGTERINMRNLPVQRTPGARMLQYANQLAEATFEVANKDGVTGEITYQKDASGNPICKAGVDCAKNSAQVKAFSSNIDTVRQLGVWFYGPL